MNFLQQILSDVDGQGSSKRVMSFGILGLISTIALGVTFFHATFQEQVWQDLIVTLLAAFGLITSEKFTKRGPAGSGATQNNQNDTNTTK
jgi:hypothetical protein